MIQNPTKHARLRKILITIILATLPCYLLGAIVLWIGRSVKSNFTTTPTLPAVISSTDTPSWGETPGIPVPTAIFDTATITMTPTETVPPTVTPTYFIPSATPTDTLEPSLTPTVTETLPVETPGPGTTVPTDPGSAHP